MKNTEILKNKPPEITLNYELRIIIHHGTGQWIASYLAMTAS